MNTTTEHIRVSSQAVGPRLCASRESTDEAVGLQRHSFGLENKQTADANVRWHLFLPAAGNRWDSELNNAGSNGNYWSRSLNTDNPNNAWNLNFNSDDCNMNNNNRNNGFSVRPVRQHLPENSVFRLTRERLLADLRQAYYDARRHKRNRPYQLRFEANLEQNLNELCDMLCSRTYAPLPSTCFIITEPKKREVFAAHFRDRIVHHLYYNYTHQLFERTFITDSYSCIKKRGTHYGINRLEQHIRGESQNYTVPCYVMKMDIRGYFMHINRKRLLEICVATLDKMAAHRVSRHRLETWQERIDMGFVKYLTEVIVMQNPIENCHMRGSETDWDGLPSDKSLFHSPEGCGLPIGNLTSQLFSNVYLNVLDQFMKRELKCKHYGRYVDDFYVVSADKEWLLSIVPKVREALSERLGLEFHDGKLQLTSVWHGTEFLGHWLKPHRIYLSRSCVGRIDRKLDLLASGSPEKWSAALNSYCGLMSHWNNYNLRKKLLTHHHDFTRIGMFNHGITKFNECQLEIHEIPASGRRDYLNRRSLTYGDSCRRKAPKGRQQRRQAV
ncbi:MAG: RNA-directed DNA polymerase [Bacteroidales bacterium]|nr:RNA-directed DNA polymerase [Bacteroidales bacterium]